ncbi:hypothetical protein D9M71_511190 [compost metagenome]
MCSAAYSRYDLTFSKCDLLTMAPRRLSGSSGSPSFQSFRCLAIRPSSWSLTSLWTIRRDEAEQFSPMFQNAPAVTNWATSSRSSQSFMTTAGFLPPSSRTMRLRLDSAAYFRNRRPVSVEPVKLTIGMSMWRPMASPTSRPPPGTRLNTPAGIPASWASSATRRALRVVSLAGLTTIEQPAASDGAIFQASISSGKFHGSTRPTTPMASRTTMVTAALPVGAVAS